MARLSASEKLERLLSIVPWVVANNGPTVAEIAERFDYPESTLLSDLDEILFMVGLYPFTPDQLIEVVLDGDQVWIRYAEYFERPLRLTPAQALTLVTAGSSLLAAPGADPDGPLARGLAKVASTLGINPGDDLDIDLGAADAGVLATIRHAVDNTVQVELEYYVYGRDEITERVVDPYRVTSDQGEWYLLGYCHRAEGERLFRVDRIRRATALDSGFDRPASVRDVSVFEPHPDDPRVTLLLSPQARWVAEAHPVESVAELSNGGLRVTLAISAQAWLERLLVRLGPDATVESTTGDLPEDLLATTAARVLARYQV